MTDEDKRLKEALMSIARTAADNSGGRLRLAYNEEDETEDHQPEAAHFLKLDGKRLGRDIELYGMMGELVTGWKALLADFLIEVILPLKHTVPESYAPASAELLELGLTVYPENLHEKWRDCF